MPTKTHANTKSLEDHTIVIRRSIGKHIFISLFIFVGIGAAGYFSWNEINHLGYIQILFILICCILLFFSVKRLADRRAYIILNTEGIQLLDVEFIQWNEIKSVDIEKEDHVTGRGMSHMRYYLILDTTDDARIEFELTDLDMLSKKIVKHINTFRSR